MSDPVTRFHYPDLEEVIFDIESMALTLLGLGCTEIEPDRKAIYWIGCQLSEAGQRLRDQVDHYLADRSVLA